MQKMQKLKPEMDELKAKFGADREAMNKAMMALYKRHSVNPLTGCLPMVMQMPVWLALYQTIGTSVELYHSPMGLWIHDLSAGDPYYVMPVILGLLMLVQSWLTTNTGTSDGLQAKLLKYGMPLMFTVFMLFLPSGLVLYILVNTTLTIVQNLIIRRRMA
jgi:YidC/Oxa1 family membrane protein insertase